MPGLGARKVKVLYDTIGVDSLESLERACREGRLASVRGFGKKSAAHLLRGIRMVRASAGLFRHSSAARAAGRLVASLSRSGLAESVSLGEALRRLPRSGSEHRDRRGLDASASPKLAKASVAFPRSPTSPRPRKTSSRSDSSTA